MYPFGPTDEWHVSSACCRAVCMSVCMIIHYLDVATHLHARLNGIGWQASAVKPGQLRSHHPPKLNSPATDKDNVTVWACGMLHLVVACIVRDGSLLVVGGTVRPSYGPLLNHYRHTSGTPPGNRANCSACSDLMATVQWSPLMGVR
jgi:hypothetical protein